MKSYKEHLKSTQSFGEEIDVLRKPVYRSSAIFPVLKTTFIDSKISFLGYWLKKRNIKQITLLVTLRNQKGAILFRSEKSITQVKAFSITLSDLLKQTKNDTELSFEGSIELEVFSVVNMVFPYPAFIVEYFSESSTAAVHTTGRVYNDIEDYQGNTVMSVAESGFDIIPKANHNPFFCFTNGPKENDGKLQIEIIDAENNSFNSNLELGTIKPFETRFVYFNEFFNLNNLLKGEKGTVKINHTFDSFFPRFIAGNFQDQEVVSITHSYYDNSVNTNEDAYFANPNPELLFDSSILIPVFHEGDCYSEIVYYPVYSPSSYSINLEFYNIQGELKASINNWKKINKHDNVFFTIQLDQLVKEFTEENEWKNVTAVKLINNWENKTQIPTRLKYGLNVGVRGKRFDLPTNICFAPQVANEKFLKKPGTFKWSPILNKEKSIIVATNSSPGSVEAPDANITLNFYREKDNETLERTIKLGSNAQVMLDINEDKEIKEFLAGENGWVTKQSSSPYLYAWYFDFSESGVVAGDHSF